MNRAERQGTIREIQDVIEQNETFYLVDFKGLRVKDISALRDRVRESSGHLRVVKNTLLKKAAEGTDLSGADFAMGDDAVAKIQGGWLDFDAMVATPDMMKDVGKLGKVLGPRGLMPNPKLGTVTFDVAGAIRDLKAGKVEFRVDKTGIIHCPVVKKSFEDAKLEENLHSLIEAVMRAKPSAAKGQYLKSAYLSTTMSPSVKLDVSGY